MTAYLCGFSLPRLNQPPFTCLRSRSIWRCWRSSWAVSRSTVAASDAVDAEAAGAVPSWPFDLTTTGWVAPPRGVPLIPAMKVAVCLPSVPIRIVPASPALPALAMSTLLEPVVRFLPAFRPMATLRDPVELSRALMPAATLLLPVVLANSALGPVATLLLPVVLENSASAPVATLLLPVVLSSSALVPVATLSLPVVLENSASTPVATLPLPVVLAYSASVPVATLSSPVVLRQRVLPVATLQRRSCWRTARRRRWRRCRCRWCWRTARRRRWRC